MKMPIVNNAPTTANPGLCSFCKEVMPKDDSGVWIMVGAMQGTRDVQSMGKENELFGFLTLSNHNGKSLEVVNNGSCGQADIGFCSKQCLSDFFIACVNEI